MIEENCPNNERGEMLDQIRAYNFSVIVRHKPRRQTSIMFIQ